MDGITMVSKISLLRHLPRFDRVGFVQDPEQWSEPLASQIARRDGLPELTHAHWLIIRALREHFRKFGAASPHIRTFVHCESPGQALRRRSVSQQT